MRSISNLPVYAGFRQYLRKISSKPFRGGKRSHTFDLRTRRQSTDIRSSRRSGVPSPYPISDQTARPKCRTQASERRHGATGPQTRGSVVEKRLLYRLFEYRFFSCRRRALTFPAAVSSHSDRICGPAARTAHLSAPSLFPYSSFRRIPDRTSRQRHLRSRSYPP